MGRIFIVVAVTIIFSASWVNAGDVDGSAGAGGIRPPTLLQMKPGAVVNAEFKAGLKATSDEGMGVDVDNLLPEPVAAKESSKITAKPAVAFRERSGMAAPSAAAPKAGREAGSLGVREEPTDPDADLEKDLVLTPPPAKPEEKLEAERIAEPKKAVEKIIVVEKKPERAKKAAPRVQKVSPARTRTYAGNTRPIVKVKPISQNPWMNPAGNYPQAPAARRMAPPGLEQPQMNRASLTAGRPQASSRTYAHGRIPLPPEGRIVRDGVTIMLTPASAPAVPQEDVGEDNNSDVLGAAAEIIGFPFAFISSFF